MDINEIASGFQIIGHRIVSLKLNNEFVVFDPLDEKYTKEFNVAYELGKPFPADEHDSIGGIVNLFIDVAVCDEEEKATIHLELEGGFVLHESNDEEQLKSMLAVNGCAALYSIGRGVISGLTSQMTVNGTGTILLPMINAFELKGADDEIE